jgi:hypothetical protein
LNLQPQFLTKKRNKNNLFFYCPKMTSFFVKI